MPDRHEEQKRAERVQETELATRHRRYVDEDLPPHEEGDRRERHQDARDCERNADRVLSEKIRSRLSQVEDPGDQDLGKRAAEIDGEIEDLVDRLQAKP